MKYLFNHRSIDYSTGQCGVKREKSVKKAVKKWLTKILFPGHRCVLAHHSFPLSLFVSIEYHNGTRKWRTVFAPSKLQPPSKERDISFHGVIMPPCRIRSRWHQTNHRGSCRSAFGVCLFHPLPNFFSVWRIHPAYASPILFQPVLFLGVELPALGIFSSCAYIRFKMILCVQTVKQFLRRCPFACRG